MAKRRKSIPVLQDGNIVNVVKREEEVAADTDWGVEGFLDVVSEIEGVAGWARYAERPGMRPEVEILLDGVLAGVVTADTFRPDLLAAGLGDGDGWDGWVRGRGVGGGMGAEMKMSLF